MANYTAIHCGSYRHMRLINANMFIVGIAKFYLLHC